MRECSSASQNYYSGNVVVITLIRTAEVHHGPCSQDRRDCQAQSPSGARLPLFLHEGTDPPEVSLICDNCLEELLCNREATVQHQLVLERTDAAVMGACTQQVSSKCRTSVGMDALQVYFDRNPARQNGKGEGTAQETICKPCLDALLTSRRAVLPR